MKWFESGAHSQTMPSGHMAHELPRQMPGVKTVQTHAGANVNPKNSQLGKLPQTKASVPNRTDLARTHAIIQQLRNVNNGQVRGPSSTHNWKNQ